MKKVSFIVPIYNVKNELERCVISLVSQDIPIEDYEIILINDGSTDGSDELADLLEEKYKNITTFHKTNGGLSDARNYGLDKANGKYVWFIDSDDSIRENCLKDLVDYMESQEYDFVDFPVNHISLNNKLMTNIKNKPNEAVSSVEFIKNYQVCFSAWCFISRTSIWKENSIIFTKDIINEDRDSVIRLLEHCEVCSHFYSEYGLYNYFIGRQGSITNEKNINGDIKSIESWFVIVDLLVKKYPPTSNNIYAQSVQAYITYFKCMLINALLNSHLDYNQRNLYIKKIEQHKYFPHQKPKVYPNFIWKLIWFLMRYATVLRLFCWLTTLKILRSTLLKIHQILKYR